MNRKILSVLQLSLIYIVLISILATVDIFSIFPLSAQKDKTTLTAILDNLGDEERWDILIQNATQKLKERHPDIDIEIKYKQFVYPNERTEFLRAMSNRTSVDLMSADQIWLGEFAGKGLLTDLTNFTERWGRSSDWYEINWDGGAHNDKIYGIWVWTDVRGLYYWKDLLNQAGVDPNSLNTWDGYIAAAKTLNTFLRSKGIEGAHLTGASHSPDLWYPYLWMLGGNIVERKSGHPNHGLYWFPAYNGTEGVRALQFLKDQVDAGIQPQKNHSWGEELVNRKFAMMVEASHVPLYFSPEQRQDLKEKVGFLPLPTPMGSNRTTTMMGGWELVIPITSKNKDLAWELITIMVEPEILTPWLERYGYLPTQSPIGQGQYSQQLEQSNPYYRDMVSMIPTGLSRPSIPEYPQVAEHIREAIDHIYNGTKEPRQALDDAAAKSANALGW
jgi:multiple sugar transport system substrate-binding protein